MNSPFSFNPHEILIDSHEILMKSYLVGGFKHLEKYDFVNGKDDIHILWKK